MIAWLSFVLPPASQQGQACDRTHLKGRRDAWLRACWHAVGWCCRLPTCLMKADDHGGAPCIKTMSCLFGKIPTGGNRQRHNGSKSFAQLSANGQPVERQPLNNSLYLAVGTVVIFKGLPAV